MKVAPHLPPIAALLLLTSCSRDASELAGPADDQQLAPLEVRIMLPAVGDSAFEADTVLFVGEATAPDLQLLPDDSTWWTAGGVPMASGRSVRWAVRPTDGVYRFHARYGEREDSATIDL